MTSSSVAGTFDITTSARLPVWLDEQDISLAFTTYEIGKLFLVGLQSNGRLSIFERTFNRCMGLCASDDGQTLWMSSSFQLWQFHNALQPGQEHDGYDRLYVPQVGYTTGDIDIHDINVDADGRVVFVNTLFSCLATASTSHSFVPIWQPPFISRLAAEARCHLNGMAMQDGQPRYATAVAATDTADGWRDYRHNGGIVMDCQSDEVITTGLSMPHSPRVYRDRLWVLNAGTGHFGYVDRSSGRFQPVTFCPGFLRGLNFAGDFAIVATSKPRDNQTFAGLDLDSNLEERRLDARSQIAVIDLRSGEIVQWLRIEGLVNELYDVVAIPGARRPMALGFRTDEISRTISIGPIQRL